MAWNCLVLFVRFGTFQRVTGTPNKKILSPFLLGPRSRQSASSIRPVGKGIAWILLLAKRLPQIIALVRARRRRRRGGIGVCGFAMQKLFGPLADRLFPAWWRQWHALEAYPRSATVIVVETLEWTQERNDLDCIIDVEEQFAGLR